MKSTSIDGLDVPYIRPCRIYFIVICIVIENAILVVQRSTAFRGVLQEKPSYMFKRVLITHC